MRNTMRLVAGLCLLGAWGAGTASAQYQYPFQNPDLPSEQRVDNIVSLMTLDEKVACLGTDPSVPRLGIHGTGHVEGCTAWRWAVPADGAGPRRFPPRNSRRPSAWARPGIPT
jgi:beta-glucosidase